MWQWLYAGCHWGKNLITIPAYISSHNIMSANIICFNIKGDWMTRGLHQSPSSAPRRNTSEQLGNSSITIDYLRHAETSVPHTLCHCPGTAGTGNNGSRSRYGTDLLCMGIFYLSVGGHYYRCPKRSQLVYWACSPWAAKCTESEIIIPRLNFVA